MIYFFIVGLVWASEFSLNIEDGILVVSDGSKTQRLDISRYSHSQRELNLIELPSDINKNDSKMRPLIEQANLYNLESKWISGKRYAYLEIDEHNSPHSKRRIRTPISLEQEIELLYYQTRSNAGLPLEPLSERKRDEIRSFVANAQRQVQERVEQDIGTDDQLISEGFIRTKSVTQSKANPAMQAAMQQGTDPFIIILDGAPYFSDMSENITYNLSTGRIDVVSENFVNCSGMSTSEITNPINAIHLRFGRNTKYYADLNLASYSVGNKILLLDTVDNLALCNEVVDVIHRDRFQGSQGFGASQ